MSKYRLLVKNASQLVQVAKNHERFIRGTKMNSIDFISGGSLCIGHDGLIKHVGTTEEILGLVKEEECSEILDLRGQKSIVPGLVDSHTHPVWNGDRCFEFAMKLEGSSYMEIHEKGGGIGYTVNQLRNASEEELIDLMTERVQRMVDFGTTTIEAKSGYGLDLENEVKMLRVIEAVKRKVPVEIVSTYLGAHSIPPGKTADEQTEDIVNNQIPAIAKMRDAGKLSVEFVDVFHEKGVFEYDNAKRIMETGLKYGFDLNIHGDELSPSGSAGLSASLGAKAVSHLEWIDDEGIRLMREHNCVAVLLPTTAHLLRIDQPPYSKMRENDVIIALASDFNPNAFCMSMPFTMNLACICLRMTMNEALVASTLNSAASINRSETHGSLETGKHGDFVIVDHANWQHLIYEMACHPILAVYKDGKRIDTLNKSLLEK